MVTSCMYAQRLDLFTAESGKIWHNGVAERVPYNQTTGYFDFIATDTQPDTMVDGKPSYFLYFLVPYDVTEIGIRFITPVPGYVYSETGDIVTESFESNKNNKDFFDPYIELEQWVDSTYDSTTHYIFIPHWQKIAKNDDSEEVISQPSGKRSNALLRVYSGPYPPGVYRMCFSAVKKSIMQGTYLVHLATIPGIKRMKVGRTLNELKTER